MLCKFADKIDLELMQILAKKMQERKIARAVVSRAAIATAIIAAIFTIISVFAIGILLAISRHFIGLLQSTIMPRPKVRRSISIIIAPIAPAALVICYIYRQTSYILSKYPR